MLTVGELKKILKGLSDDTKVITRSSNFEMQGAIVDARVTVMGSSHETGEFRDAFDGMHYRSKVYVPNERGEKCLYILG